MQLSPREFWLLVQAAVLLPAVRLALKFVTVARLQLLGGQAVRDPLTSGLPPESTARLVRIAAERGLYCAKCLEQSLVLRWLLQRQGIDARITFGARKEDEEMQAHAWVEVNGVALNEDDGVHERFSPFEERAASNFN